MGQSRAMLLWTWNFVGEVKYFLMCLVVVISGLQYIAWKVSDAQPTCFNLVRLLL